MEPWKTLFTEKLLSFGRFLTVERHRVELPGGRVIDDWPWLLAPDFVNVLLLDESGAALVFKQGKYGLQGESLAPVGGYIEPGEEPLAAARRELLEETGYSADEWIALGRFVVDPNRGLGRGTLFLAKGARQVAERNADDLEDQRLVRLSLEEVESALAEGRFQALAWTANIALALLHMKREER